MPRSFSRKLIGRERLTGGPLNLLRSDVRPDAGGAVLGYPQGAKDLVVKPGAVLKEFAAIGRDIYGRKLTRRNVYQLQAVIRQGNSGGPFVRKDGAVMGVIFAASTTDTNVGYALTSQEVAETDQVVTDKRQAGEPEGGPADDHVHACQRARQRDRRMRRLVVEHASASAAA